MPTGQKYVKITEWLADCGKSSVRLTFQQLNDISTLPASAYSARQLWANSGQSFSCAWLSANYKVTSISMSEQWVEFTLQSGQTLCQKASAQDVQQKNTAEADRQLLSELIDCGRSCIDAIRSDRNHRYRSWEYCYRAFIEPCDLSPERIDHLALHLAWYLGSWGMLRNSFLQNKDYKVHIPVVKTVMDPKWDTLRGLPVEKLAAGSSADMILELTSEITDRYQKHAGGTPTDTLLTKILLGTLGCVPAYDRYFKDAVRKTGIAPGIFGKRSLLQLGAFYLAHSDTLEAFRRTCPSEIVDYPPAKVIDMCFFGYGAKHDARAKP